MKRTQLYLDLELWNTLHARAKTGGTTISELVRQAVRERYMGNHEARRTAMQDFVGVRKADAKGEDSTSYIRKLRQGTRLEKLHNQ